MRLIKFLGTLTALFSGAALAATPSTQPSGPSMAAPGSASITSSRDPDNKTVDSTGSNSVAKIKYKAGKDVNFEELLIQGQLKRPELSVVTGNTQPGSDGLLRLRENFIDRITTDVGEELP